MKAEAFDRALDDIDVRLERLFKVYDQFLAGDERVDPVGLQKDIGRRIVRLQGEANVSGAAGARYRSIVERYRNLQRYWERLSGRMKSGAHQRPLSEDVEEPRAIARSASSGGWNAAKIDGPIRETTLNGHAEERPLVPRSPLPVARPRDPAKRRTPPLGTPAVHEPWGAPPSSHPEPKQELESMPEILPTSIRPPAPSTDTSKTTVDLRFPHGSDSAKTVPDLEAHLRDTAITKPNLRPPTVDEPASRAETRRVNAPPWTNGGKTLPMLARPTPSRPVSEDDVDTIPKLRVPGAVFGELGDTESEQTPTAQELADRRLRRAATLADVADGARPAPSTGLTPERVLEIQSLLVTMNPGAGPVSVQRLTKLLEECEAKLRARHGNRSITFDVVMKDGKGVIKPIVR